MGFVLSGLLTGILASRVISGYIGEWLGWREMFFIAALVMVVCMGIMMLMMPEMKRNYVGTYRGLMTTVAEIFILHPSIRIYSIRAAFGFGSMMAIWSCLAFHLAQPPFYAGSDMVGMLGLCGIMGAVAASSVGKLVPRFGIHKFSLFGAAMQIIAWAIALLFGDTYAGLIAAIILVDIGLQMSAAQQSEWLPAGDSAGFQPCQHHLHDDLFHRWFARYVLCRIRVDPSRLAGSLHRRHFLRLHLPDDFTEQ